MDPLKEYLYSTYHLWLREIEDNKFILGVTNYIIEDMREINTINLTEIGVNLLEGDFFGTLENSQEVYELPMPLDGEIIDVNPKAEKELSLLEDNPLDIWLIKIRVTNEEQIYDMLNEKEYSNFII